MERDEDVFVLGEDVGAYGGIFSSTTGLLDRFGPERVLDTPISETGFIGAAIGAATEGMRPIVELMFVDFFGVCMDQIYNHMAKIHYESGGNVRVPMVLMTAVGGGYSDGAQHSQCLWGHLRAPSGHEGGGTQQPGRRGGPHDRRHPGRQPGRLHVPQGRHGTAVDGEEPPLDRAGAHGRPRGRDRQGGHAAPRPPTHRRDALALGAPRPRRRRRGGGRRRGRRSDRPAQHRAAGHRDHSRVRRPYRPPGDRDEDYQSFGLSGEIVARIAEHDPSMLRGPISRVAVPDVPIPYARSLEYAALPTRARIKAAVLAQVGR